MTLLSRCLDLGGFKTELMLREEAATLPVRCLMIWGDKDAFAPPSSGEALVPTMRDARLEVVPNAGHLPWFDAPQRCAELVRDFLDATRSLLRNTNGRKRQRRPPPPPEEPTEPGGPCPTGS